MSKLSTLILIVLESNNRSLENILQTSVKATIFTCNGLYPCLNNVIRHLVITFEIHGYREKKKLGDG